MPSSVSSLTEGSLMKAIWSVAPVLHLSAGATCLTLSLHLRQQRVWIPLGRDVAVGGRIVGLEEGTRTCAGGSRRKDSGHRTLRGARGYEHDVLPRISEGSEDNCSGSALLSLLLSCPQSHSLVLPSSFAAAYTDEWALLLQRQKQVGRPDQRQGGSPGAPLVTDPNLVSSSHIAARRGEYPARERQGSKLKDRNEAELGLAGMAPPALCACSVRAARPPIAGPSSLRGCMDGHWPDAHKKGEASAGGRRTQPDYENGTDATMIGRASGGCSERGPVSIGFDRS